MVTIVIDMSDPLLLKKKTRLRSEVIDFGRRITIPNHHQAVIARTILCIEIQPHPSSRKNLTGFYPYRADVTSHFFAV